MSSDSYGLGFGCGDLVVHTDGNVDFHESGKGTPSFRLHVHDIEGFAARPSSRADRKRLRAPPMAGEVLSILGAGITIVEIAVAHGISKQVVKALRTHPEFRANVDRPSMTPEPEIQPSAIAREEQANPPARTLGIVSVAEELMKLARLRHEGHLTDEEFRALKAKLL